MTIQRLACAFLLVTGCSFAQSAPAWDTSGNGLLNGTSYFREIIWLVGDNSGDLGEAAAIYGNITFDGNGNYSLSGAQVLDTNTSTTPQTYTATGTYHISASGYGFMDNPYTSDTIYGMVSNGVFIGSSTDNSVGFNDLLIAAPVSNLSLGSLSGTYLLADLDSPTFSGIDARDSLVTVTADGAGNLSFPVQATGYIGGSGGGVTRQSLGSKKYLLSNNAFNLQLGGNALSQISNPDSVLVSGNYYLYMSPDGNFVFGGSPNGWDMFVGVRSGSGTPPFNGLFYQAGMDIDLTQLASQGDSTPDSYFGSLVANAGGVQGQILGHQRINSIFNQNAFDETYPDAYQFKSDGSIDDAITGQHYLFSPNGAYRIGLGDVQAQGAIGINVAIQAPSLTGPGVYLNPEGIANAASSALFTARVAPGELLTLYGSNLATSAVSDGTMPASLGGVQVLMNGTPAPVYEVSPGRVSALVPYEIQPSSDPANPQIMQIQVMSPAGSSNVITALVGATAPGVYTEPPGGIGPAAAQHADYSLITSSNPAQANETIIVYTAGLGAVSPAVADGSVAPSNPLSNTSNTISAFFDCIPANGVCATGTVTFAGLSPGFVGLYQVNVTVPTGIPPGNVDLDLAGPDSYTEEAIIPIASGVASAVSPRTQTQARPRRQLEKRALRGSSRKIQKRSQ